MGFGNILFGRTKKKEVAKIDFPRYGEGVPDISRPVRRFRAGLCSEMRSRRISERDLRYRRRTIVRAGEGTGLGFLQVQFVRCRHN